MALHDIPLILFNYIIGPSLSRYPYPHYRPQYSHTYPGPNRLVITTTSACHPERQRRISLPWPRCFVLLSMTILCFIFQFHPGNFPHFTPGSSNNRVPNAPRVGTGAAGMLGGGACAVLVSYTTHIEVATLAGVAPSWSPTRRMLRSLHWLALAPSWSPTRRMAGFAQNYTHWQVLSTS